MAVIKKTGRDMRVILNGEDAIKSVFDGRNPPMVDEIAHAMKSCFAGLYLDGFDFIGGLSPDFI